MISGSSRKEKEVGPVGGTDSHAFVTCENVLTDIIIHFICTFDLH